MKLCSPLEVNSCFEVTRYLHVQRPRISQNRVLLATCLMLVRTRRHVRPKGRLTSNGLRGTISQKTEPSITTAVRNPNPNHSKRLYERNLTVWLFLEGFMGSIPRSPRTE
jgi:hypothetical protein